MDVVIGWIVFVAIVAATVAVVRAVRQQPAHRPGTERPPDAGRLPERYGAIMLRRDLFVAFWARDSGPVRTPYGTVVANVDYASVLLDVVRYDGSPQAPADTSSTLVCEGCGRVHGTSFVLGLTERPVGAPVDRHAAACPRCGGDRSVLLRGVSTVETGPSTLRVIEPATTERSGARAPMTRHLERLAAENPRLHAARGCRRLGDDDVLDFVLGARAVELPEPDERIPAAVGRFDGFDVVVSVAPRSDPAAIRAMLPHGYFGYLDALVRTFGLHLGTRDVAHWVIGHGADDTYAVHLAYLPTGSGVPRLVPVDLLTDEERRTVLRD